MGLGMTRQDCWSCGTSQRPPASSGSMLWQWAPQADRRVDLSCIVAHTRSILMATFCNTAPKSSSSINVGRSIA